MADFNKGRNMADSRIFNRTFKVLSNSLDISARRHTVIAGNIANMDTIGYKPRDIDFKKTLKEIMNDKQPRTMSVTDPKHFSGEDAVPTSIKSEISRYVDLEHLDSVNIDTEMDHLVENNIKFSETTEMLLRKMSILRNAIQEGE